MIELAIDSQRMNWILLKGNLTYYAKIQLQLLFEDQKWVVLLRTNITYVGVIGYMNQVHQHQAEGGGPDTSQIVL